MRHEAGVLHHVADPAAQRDRVAVENALAVNLDLAGGRLEEALEDLDGGGLPCPIRPEQPEALSRADLEIEAVDGGCEVSIREDATTGPAKLVPGPLRQLGMVPRNRETLRRLACLAEGGAADDVSRAARGSRRS
jgi:hypothetical protein